ncbi:MAG: hypothetical protein ACMG6E_02790, partial [Candidatus Roizmanbacteria bacterium]
MATDTSANKSQQLLIGALVVAALVIGYLYGQNKTLTNGTPTTNTATAGANDAQNPQPKPEDVAKVTTKDHVKGDLSKAKVALIEYSDF